jgi:hypothetical protein
MATATTSCRRTDGTLRRAATTRRVRAVASASGTAITTTTSGARCVRHASVLMAALLASWSSAGAGNGHPAASAARHLGKRAPFFLPGRTGKRGHAFASDACLSASTCLPLPLPCSRLFTATTARSACTLAAQTAILRAMSKQIDRASGCRAGAQELNRDCMSQRVPSTVYILEGVEGLLHRLLGLQAVVWRWFLCTVWTQDAGGSAAHGGLKDSSVGASKRSAVCMIAVGCRHHHTWTASREKEKQI